MLKRFYNGIADEETEGGEEMKAADNAIRLPAASVSSPASPVKMSSSDSKHLPNDDDQGEEACAQ